MISDEKIEEIAAHLSKDIQLITATRINYKGGLISHKNYSEKVLTLKFMKKWGVLEEYVEDVSGTTKLILDNIGAYLEYIKDMKLKEKMGTSDMPKSSFNPFNYIPFVDVTDNNNRIMVNKSSSRVVDLDYNVWLGQLSVEDRKTVGRPDLGRLIFNPYQKNHHERVPYHDDFITNINLYEPPVWMRDERGGNALLSEEEQESLECPEEIMEFLSILFPDGECRKFVINWMHFALTKRCETYLVLNGKRGAGKGIFCDQLMRSLLGEENYKIAPESLLDSIFNSVLDRTRMIVFDEVKVDQKHSNKLKKYINNKQNIEKKGLDANEVVDTFSSMIISNNSVNDMYLEWDERRFSVPELNSNPLTKSWSKRKIDKFVKRFEEDKEFVKQFGYWVFYKGRAEGIHEFTTWERSKFNEIVYNSLSEWKKVIVDMVLDNKTGEVELSDCKKEYKKRVEHSIRWPRPGLVRDFLDNYEHLGKRLGTYSKEDGEELILVEYNEKNEVTSDEDATGLL